jgi:hypothetical protein
VLLTALTAPSPRRSWQSEHADVWPAAANRIRITLGDPKRVGEHLLITAHD